MRHRLQEQQQRHQALQQHLQALDPAAVLRRGYALVRDERGSLVRNPCLPPQTRLRIELAGGSFWVRVEESHEPPQT